MRLPAPAVDAPTLGEPAKDGVKTSAAEQELRFTVRIGITYTAKDFNRSPDEPVAGTDDREEEFDSPETIAAIVNALRSLGHDVVELGDGEPMVRRLLSLDPRPDLAFNLAEGRRGGRSREACVPAVLEMFGIPYTGSDPLTLAATLDKTIAKAIVADRGVSVPRGLAVDPDEQDSWPVAQREIARWSLPWFCKPAFEGSSKGIRRSCLIRRSEDLEPMVRRLAAEYRQPVLVEEFIEGDELTVGVIGNPPQLLGIMRVRPIADSGEPFVYSIEVKRNFREEVVYECPAAISAAAAAAVESATRAAWRALGCRDVARFDFRLRGETPYFLEVNPLPGLSPGTSDLVIMGNLIGVSHVELIRRIVEAASSRIRACGNS